MALSDTDWAKVRAIQRRAGAEGSKRLWKQRLASGEWVRKSDLAEMVADLVTVCGSKANARRWITETTGVAVSRDHLRFGASRTRTVSAVIAAAIRSTHLELVGTGPADTVLPNLLTRQPQPRRRREIGQGSICKNGHHLDVVGAYYNAGGYALCVGCHRMNMKKYKQRRKSAAA